MNRELALVRRLLVLLVAVTALAGCTVLGVSTLPPAAPTPAATPESTATAVPPVATATTLPVAVVLPSPVPPTRTATPTATSVPPTETAVPTTTSTSVPTATTAAKAPTAKPATATATKQPATATKRPTPKATATKAPAPSGKVVGLDPGHHYLDQGGYSALIGTPEYKLTMQTALAAKSILESRGYTVRLSRTNDNPVSCWCASTYTAKVQAEQEARIRAVGAVSAYVPIHFNASPTHTLKGTQSYYNVDQPGVASQSKILAQDLVASVVYRIRKAGYPTVNWGARSDLLVGKSYGHYFGLRGPYPSSLLESLYMDQPDDAAALKRPEIRAAIAQGIADGIVAFLH